MLNHELDILSLRQLEYEMEGFYLPDDYNLFGIGYCGRPDFPFLSIQQEKFTELILSNFQ